MSRHGARVGSLTIANTGQNSPGILSLQFGRSGMGAAIGLTIYAPATLPEAITVEVLPYGSSTWRTLQSGGADVTVAAGKAVVVSPLPFGDLRLHAGVAVGGDRTFDIDSQIDGTGYNL